jgi:hypothetical protein
MRRRRWALMAATPAALAGLTIATTGVFAGSSAGKPVAQNELLCGLFTPAADNFSGASNIDHPDGASSAGMSYPYAGQNCENPGSSDGNYTWTITHSNVHTGGGPQDERGTEHVQFALDVNGDHAAGAQGHVTNFDLSSADNVGDPCAPRTVYYASGHAYDATGTCSPGSVGNFNTHGGAATGDHFRGNYGTVVYQWGDATSNSPCKNGSPNYCFEGILQGQTN